MVYQSGKLELVSSVGTRIYQLVCFGHLINIKCHYILYYASFRIIPCAVIVYIVVGIVVMKYHYKATGSDIIPNKKFWTALPLLVKVYRQHAILTVAGQ